MPEDLSLNRRGFLHLVAGAAGAALVPAPLAAWADAVRPHQRVLIIGAGLAGLTAAFELDRHGHRVKVLEARPHPGGRVLTLRHPFDDQLFAEAGGEWIHPNHLYMRHYAREFRLELEPDEGAMAVLEDSGLRPRAEAEAAIPGFTEMRRRVAEHLEQVNVFQRPDRSALAALDRMSYLDFLRSLKATDAAIAYERALVSTLMTVDVSEISALHMFYEYGLPQPETTESRLCGGNSLLIEAFVRRLRERLRLGAGVTAVEADDRGVQVRYRQHDVERRETADHVIIAIPGTEVRRLRFNPPLPDELARAYAALGYGRVMKVVLQARQRFWEKTEPAYDDIFTRQEATHIYQSSQRERTARGLLTFYVAARGADAWGPLGGGEQVAAARRLLGDLWQAGPAEIERGTSWFWNAQRWIGGSYAFFAPGEMVSVRAVLRQAAGRIHFAGEHTAVWQGYMNGAVESGVRAAAEIEPAVGALYQELMNRSRGARTVPPWAAAA